MQVGLRHASGTTLRQRRTAAVFFLVFAALSGCPETTPTATRILRVEPRVIPEGNRLVLTVVGRGFGLSDIAYDLGRGEGTGGGGDLTLEVFGPALTRRTQAGELVLRSPQEIAVDAEFSSPLPVGRYGIRLFEGGDSAVAELEEAFSVEGGTPGADAGLGGSDGG